MWLNFNIFRIRDKTRESANNDTESGHTDANSSGEAEVTIKGLKRSETGFGDQESILEDYNNRIFIVLNGEQHEVEHLHGGEDIHEDDDGHLKNSKYQVSSDHPDDFNEHPGESSL